METLHAQLAARSLPIMVAFQSDLEHDREWLLRNPYVGFVHITTASSTHIFAIPADFGKNERVPYLFGHATPREIAHGEMTVIHAMDRAGSVFQYCPTTALAEHLRIVQPTTGLAALNRFREGYEAACERLTGARTTAAF